MKLISKKGIKDKPWIAASLKKCISKKNNLFYTYTKHHSSKNKEKYANYSNVLVACIRPPKKSYFRELFDNKSTRITKMWRVLGEILNLEAKSKSSSIKEIFYDDKWFRDGAVIANAQN